MTTSYNFNFKSYIYAYNYYCLRNLAYNIYILFIISIKLFLYFLCYDSSNDI